MHHPLRPAMSIKLHWPILGQTPTSIFEHLIFSLHTNQAIIKAIEANDKKDKRPPVDIFLKHLEAIEDALSVSETIRQRKTFCKRYTP